MAGYAAPQTEAELLARVPPSNHPGVLPRDILPPGEKVYYETRPGLLSLYWGRLIFNGLYLSLWVAFAISVPDAAFGALFLSAPAILWVIVLYFQWRHRIYALTDQRVIRISGMRGTDFQDAAYAQIHDLSSGPGSIRFDTTPPPTAAGYFSRGRTRVIHWDALSDVARVLTFVQQAFAFGLRQGQMSAATQAQIDRIAEMTLPCPYCGAPIDLATLDPANPRCPRCSAPIALPR